MDDDLSFNLNSIHDRQNYVARRNSRENYQDDRDFPSLKLNISDSFALEMDASFEGNSDPTKISFLLQKHQQNIARFDVAQKLGEKDRQILECKTTISILEGKLENFKSLYKSTKSECESEVENYKTKQFQDKEKIEILEEKIKKLTEQKQNVHDEIFKNREMGEFHRLQKEKSLLERNKIYVEKLDELQEKVSYLEDAKYDLMNMVNEKSSELEMHKNENKLLKERISSLESQVADLRNTKKDLELFQKKLQQSVANNKELESRLNFLKEQEKKLHLFEETIVKLPALQKEIVKLKEENNMHRITHLNIDLLKEQLSSAENRLESMEIKCKDLTGENATLVTLRELSEEYESATMKEFGFEFLPPVSEFVDIIRNMKKRDEEVEQSLNELRASIESYRSSKDKQEEINNSLKSELKKCHSEITKNAALIKRFQRKIFLLSKERDSLQSLIETYQTETAALNPSSVEQEQIKHLKTELSNYRKEIKKLEEELNKAQQLPNYDESNSEDKGYMSFELSCANEDTGTEDSLAQLKEENEILKSQIEYYENFGNRDHSADKIHSRDNPLEKACNERKTSYDKLLKENEILKQEIKLLRGGVSTNLTESGGKDRAGNEIKNKRIKDLEGKVKTLEIRNKRLLEALEEEEEPQELREIVFQLLGYRIDCEADKCYKLISIYAESQEDYLLFQQSSNGEMKLLENKFSDSLDDVVKSFMYHDNSPPALLSSITLDLHSRQTTMPTSDQEDEYEGGEEDEEEPMGEEEEVMGEEEEEMEEEEESSLEPAAKRPRHDFEEEDQEEEEEEDEEEEEEEENNEDDENNEEDEEDNEVVICLD